MPGKGRRRGSRCPGAGPVRGVVQRVAWVETMIGELLRMDQRWENRWRAWPGKRWTPHR